jgi:hypothetical protein
VFAVFRRHREVGLVFRRRQTKTHGRLAREELSESMGHLRMAAAHAAGGAAGAIAPRLEAARGRVEPTVNRSLDWLSDTATYGARQASKQADKVARKAKGKKRGNSMTQRRWPMMVGGLLIAGAAAGAAGALISRRRQKKWNEYGTSQSFAGSAKSSIDAGMDKASTLAEATDVLGQVRGTTGGSATDRPSPSGDIGTTGMSTGRGAEYGSDAYGKTATTSSGSTSKNSRP